MLFFWSKENIKNSRNYIPNIWDILILTVILSIIFGISWSISKMSTPYDLGNQIKISLDPSHLPEYAGRTVLRMFIALIFSLIATFTLAPLAAWNRHAERIIIPAIDILQSIPILGMLSISVIAFIKIFPGSLLGPECAAIFAIFTSQVWNMILSLYQSLKTIPKDLVEVSRIYHMSNWQKFWRIYVPFGAPGLLWNTMMSMSAGWFFVVLSEAISVNNQTITLPGIGSYIQLAISQSDITSIGYAIIAMFTVILIYDQLLFRPLLVWAEKFKSEIDDEEVYYESWIFDLLARTHLLKKLETFSSWLGHLFIGKSTINPKQYKTPPSKNNATLRRISLNFYYICLAVIMLYATANIIEIIKESIKFKEVIYVSYLGLITAVKVVILIFLASIIWIPIGVWIGLNPRISSIVQPIIQFIASFPANLFYPIAVLLIIKFNLNHQIWTTPLMILGTQWYILFNVIAGTATIPKELKLAAKSLGLRGVLWWTKLALPAIFPFFITGAMTAAGGCWNASIVAEFVQWGDHTFVSLGLGSYIEQYTREGDFPRIALGITVMCIYVLAFNRLVWQKLYNLAQTRFTLD
ncbi:MAG: ABC transporter permease subunit [Francisellaceae bacterium]|jgi:NitT/TauT family transport system permease protein|nr:ABC transporter permease subunit [Francisellaceae bacterium]MBT6539034.1 ABC transporter permease subunit [Francisellaceae bacterium]